MCDVMMLDTDVCREAGSLRQGFKAGRPAAEPWNENQPETNPREGERIQPGAEDNAAVPTSVLSRLSVVWGLVKGAGF